MPPQTIFSSPVRASISIRCEIAKLSREIISWRTIPPFFSAIIHDSGDRSKRGEPSCQKGKLRFSYLQRQNSKMNANKSAAERTGRNGEIGWNERVLYEMAKKYFPGSVTDTQLAMKQFHL
jgi:hypothetical protein